MTFAPVALEGSRIVVFTDASWANAEDMKSLGRMSSAQGDRASLLDWRSHRIQRRCRSTLSAETMSLDAGLDAAIFARELLAETLVASHHPTQCGRLPMDLFRTHAITDCRSLHDLVTKDSPLAATQEKRLTLDIGALQEAATELHPDAEELRDTFRWADTLTQLADHLTKITPFWQLHEALGRNRLALQKLDPKETKDTEGHANADRSNLGSHE